MTILDPLKPWAVVLCTMEGSSPPASVADDFRTLFSGTPEGLRAYWRDVTRGAVDVSGTQVFGWYPTGWSMVGSPGLRPYPGATGKTARDSVLMAEARRILQAQRPDLDLAQFRGVIGVFNFACNAGASGRDVAYGLAFGDTPTWAEGGWQRCATCNGLVQVTKASAPCTNGTTHILDTSATLLVPTNAQVINSMGGFAACRNCGGLYEASVLSGCPAGTPFGSAHQPSATAYRLLSGWPAAIGEDQWHRCTKCGLVLHGRADKVEGQVCSAGTQHSLAVGGADEFNVPVMSFQYNRTFLAHEMGHAYGFVHSRNTDPHSTDRTGDCYPGGYGDSYDIMSAMGCDYFTPPPAQYGPIGKGGRLGPRFGQAGPALSVHHLLDQQLLSENDVRTVTPSGTAGQVVTLHPVDSPLVVGYALLRADHFLAELRMHDGENGQPGWDRALNFDGASAAVVVYDVGGPSPVRVRSAAGRDYLVAGDYFEARVGVGLVRMYVESIDAGARQARVSVDFPRMLVNTWQRWIVLPCAYSDVASTPLSIDELRDLLAGGVETYWSDVSGGHSGMHAGWVLSATGGIPDTPGEWLPIGESGVDDNRSPLERVRASVDAVLALPGVNGTEPFYLDWRWFTGIIVVRNTPAGGGHLGRIAMRSGNATAYLPKCSQTTALGTAAGDLDYDVIELGTEQVSSLGKDMLTSAQFNKSIGASLGLQPNGSDRFHLMSDRSDAYRFTAPSNSAPIKASWGPSGPAISADEMATLGWLDDRDVTVEIPNGRDSTAGAITLAPLLDRNAGSGYLRARIGGWTLELRVKRMWDSGLPELTAVIAMTGGQAPVALRLGEGRQWGGHLPLLGGGGGSFSVTQLTPDSATVSYRLEEGRVLVAGGGVLHGGGTILITPDGHILRIPPGDPWEGRVREILDRLRPAVEDLLRRGEGPIL